MFERISNGWELAKESWNVLKLDKELLLFPLLSGIACLLVLASFAVPLWNSPYAEAILNDQQAPAGSDCVRDPVPVLPGQLLRGRLFQRGTDCLRADSLPWR